MTPEAAPSTETSRRLDAESLDELRDLERIGRSILSRLPAHEVEGVIWVVMQSMRELERLNAPSRWRPAAARRPHGKSTTSGQR